MKLSLRFLLLYFAAVFLLTGYQLRGQDDPYSDFIDPVKFSQQFHPVPPLEQMITIDGYDNFYLGLSTAEPHGSLNPKNPRQSFTGWNINVAFRSYNGLTWQQSTPQFGVSMSGDPVTAFDSLGNLYYQNMFGSPIQGAKVMKSTDNGATWGPSLTGVSGRDKNWIAADQSAGPYSNYVYGVMSGPSASSAGNFWRTTDLGATWNQTAVMNTQLLPGMMVAVGPNVANGNNISGGAVYVVTHSGSNAAGIYTFYVSTDGGATFTLKSTQTFSNLIGTEISGRSTVQGMRTRPYPMIAADNSWGQFRGRLYLVYASNNPAGNGNKSDIFSRYSTDQGATWSSPVIVNDDPNSQSNFQFFPAIWCDKETGRLFAKWYDTRRVPTSDSMDVYASYSDDGGVTWAPNQRITNRTFKIKLSTSGSAPAYQGDYDAISSVGNVSLAIWTDFRNNNYGSYVGYFPDYALTVTPESAQMYNADDSLTVSVNIPSVKLWSDKVKFTATLTPTPVSGSLQVIFPQGDSLMTFPSSLPVKIKTSGEVSTGTYTLVIEGSGPNGIPVHQRTVSILVQQVIPVELTSFQAKQQDNSVTLEWMTATETNNKGFEIERKIQTGLITEDWQKIGYIEGAGTVTETKQYSFTDRDLNKVGKFSYRLRQIDFDGKFNFTPEVFVNIDKPVLFGLSKNYPNPFNPSTRIEYYLPESAEMTLKVYDAIGREVAVLVNGFTEAGRHDIIFNASGLSSGIYIYEMKAGSFLAREKMSLVK